MRSWADPFTNRVVLQAPDLLEWLPQLIRAGGGPSARVMPTFLHEATHHWCFSSPVGTTIASLKLRSLIAAFRAVEAATAEERMRWERQAAEDQARADTATALLRPLAEGFASFAEFDLAPWHRSPVMPAPIRWAVMFQRDASVRATRREHLMTPAFQALAGLALERLRDPTRGRKEGLLSEPLSCNDSDGYLAGYLLLKSLWRFVGARHERFMATDTFMLFAYHFFYEDEEFVHVLLDQALEAPASLDAIHRHIEARFVRAFDRPTGESLDGFFSELSTRRHESYGQDNFLAPSSPHDVAPSQQFIEAWDRAIGPLNALVPADTDLWTDSHFVTLSCHAIMHSRDLFRIGSTPVTATITGGSARVCADQGEPLVLPLKVQTQDGTIEAALDVYLGTRGGERVAALTTADGAIAWDARPHPEEEDVVSITRSLHAETAFRAVETLIQGRADQLNELRELTRLSGYVEQTNQRLDGLYQPFASIYVPEQLVEELWSLMSDEGFYGLFEGEGDLVRALAIVGILGSNGFTPSSIEGTFAEQGLDYRSMWEALERVATRFNLFALTADGDRVFSTI